MKNNPNVLLKLFAFSSLAVFIVSCGTNNKKGAPIQTISPNNSSYSNNSTSTGYHRVQAGENLYRISLKYNTTVANLSRMNGISDPSQIKVGQTL
ncbi:MAG: LysM peptidoglycan-binding domain-containing protein, partial [Neisseriaceae bacterium]|nr:LysM peptidoglycan-binding domain-containing protein [Neisseriaceae bacterium]